jgi:hypothetical protein
LRMSPSGSRPAKSATSSSPVRRAHHQADRSQGRRHRTLEEVSPQVKNASASRRSSNRRRPLSRKSSRRPKSGLI